MSSVTTPLEIVALAWTCPLCYCLPFPLLYDNSVIRLILNDPFGAMGSQQLYRINYKLENNAVYHHLFVCVLVYQSGAVGGRG